MTDFREYSAVFMSQQNDLYHYGVKGMKWGVRRYQNKDGTLTPEGKNHYRKNGESKDPEDKSAAAALAIMFAPHIALGVVGVTYATGAKIAEVHREKKLYKPEDNPNSLSRKNLKKVNPNFGKQGYTENCSKCSIVTELVARGITEYTAGKGNGLPRNMHERLFKGAKSDKLEFTNETTLSKAFEKYPNGASGSYGFSYSGGMSGHSIHWTKLKNGQIRFEDGQTGKSYNIENFFKEYQPGEALSSSIIRLDNCEPDYDMLTQLEVLSSKKK